MSRLANLISCILPLFLGALEEKPFVILASGPVLEQKYSAYRIIPVDGTVASKTRALFWCGKNEIVVDLSAGSQFVHDSVLNQLNRLYADPAVWVAANTFYAGLFQEMHKGDLLYQDKFIENAGSLPYMVPILGMAQTIANL